jgi:DHA1 family bicyclomycin/chloramphenicol resistance-like MFS transporter
VRDVYDRERSASALATIMMVMSLTPSLSPAIGAYLAQWVGWRIDFVLLGLVGATVLILSFVVATAFTSASWRATCLPSGYTSPRAPMGLWSSYRWPGYILGNASLVRLSVLLGSTRLFIVGLALSLASGAMLVIWCLADLTPWALFVPMAISSIGNGMSQPSGVAAGPSVYPRIAGAASGLTGFTQMIIAALGTLLLGLLPRGSVLAMVAVVSVSLTLALVCGLLTLRAPTQALRPAPAARLRGQVAKGS